MKNDQTSDGFHSRYVTTEIGLVPSTREMLKNMPIACNNPRLKHIVHKTPILVVVK